METNYLNHFYTSNNNSCWQEQRFVYMSEIKDEQETVETTDSDNKEDDFNEMSLLNIEQELRELSIEADSKVKQELAESIRSIKDIDKKKLNKEDYTYIRDAEGKIQAIKNDLITDINSKNAVLSAKLLRLKRDYQLLNRIELQASEDLQKAMGKKQEELKKSLISIENRNKGLHKIPFLRDALKGSLKLYERKLKHRIQIVLDKDIRKALKTKISEKIKNTAKLKTIREKFQKHRLEKISGKLQTNLEDLDEKISEVENSNSDIKSRYEELESKVSNAKKEGKLDEIDVNEIREMNNLKDEYIRYKAKLKPLQDEREKVKKMIEIDKKSEMGEILEVDSKDRIKGLDKNLTKEEKERVTKTVDISILNRINSKHLSQDQLNKTFKLYDKLSKKYSKDPYKGIKENGTQISELAKIFRYAAYSKMVSKKFKEYLKDKDSVITDTKNKYQALQNTYSRDVNKYKRELKNIRSISIKRIIDDIDKSFETSNSKFKSLINSNKTSYRESA